MEITLEYQTQLTVADAYMEIEFLRECPDIVRYLKNPDSYAYNEALKERIGQYLEDLGIIYNSNNNELTRLGKAIKKSGKRYRAEYGKYKIAFLYEDKIFGTRIVTLERTTANKNNKELFDKRYFKEDSYFVFELGNEDKMEQIKLQEKNIFIEKSSVPQNFCYHCRFDSEGDRFMEETLKIDDKVMPIKNAPFFMIENIKDKAHEVLRSAWDGKYYSLSLSDMENSDEDIREFKITMEDDHFTFKDIPCIPCKKEAQQWLKKCLLKDLEEYYMPESDFWDTIEYYCAKTPLQVYREDCEKIDYDNFINSIQKEKNMQTYWHAHAPKDLLPVDKIFSQITVSDENFRPILYTRGDEVSYKEIADKILNGRECRYCIYIDNYCKKRQEIKQVAFIEAIFNNGKVRAEIITDFSKAERNIVGYSELNRDIKILDRVELGIAEHDRFLLLLVDNFFEAWTIPQSDFLEYNISRNKIPTGHKLKVSGPSGRFNKDSMDTFSKNPRFMDHINQIQKEQ